MGEERSRSPSCGRASDGGRERRAASGSGSTASPRRATALSERLRVVLFAPEDMLLVAGSPSLRRATVDQLAATVAPGYAAEPRDVRPRAPAAQRPAPGDPRRDRVARGAALLGPALPRRRRGGRGGPPRAPRRLAAPLAAAHAEIAPEEAAGRPSAWNTRRTRRPGPDETPGDALAGASPRPPRRRSGTARRSSGPTGTTSFAFEGRDLPASPRAASSGPRSSPSSSPSSTS